MTFAPISLLRRWLTPKPHGELPHDQREGRRETADETLRRRVKGSGGQ